MSVLAAPRRDLLGALEAAIGTATELAAAALVLAEILLLLAGVIARYGFDRPLVWSDELASMLFLWLAMLGAAIALRRAEHMLMTALVARADARRKPLLDALALAASVLFLALLLGPTFAYANEQAAITTPAMQISDAWRASALPAGTLAMLLVAMVRLLRCGRAGLVAVVCVGILAGAFALGGPVFPGLGNFNLLIFFVGVVAALVFAGVPIAFAFGLAAYAYLALAAGIPLAILVGRIDEGMSSLILLAVPLFVFLGLLIEMTGMARAMVTFLAGLLGHVRGGMHYVLVAGMYLVSGISGSKAADMAAIAPVLFPEMRARGADAGDLVALLSATGAQTETVPPSLVLITIGSVTGVSIAALFTGGLLPGLVVSVLLCIVVWRRRRGDTPLPRTPRAEVLRSFVVALPALVLPFLIRFTVMDGIATATEVSTVGIAYATLVGLLLYRRFDWRRLVPMLVETASLSGAILMIIGTATGMAWGLTQSGFSQALAAAMRGLPGGHYTFMAASIVTFIVLGSVLEGIPAIVLFGPLLFPIAREVGINEVHYAMVVILSMGIGLFAPPFGVGYYTACAIGRVDPAEGMRAMTPYILTLLVGTLLIAFLPWISTGFL